MALPDDPLEATVEFALRHHCRSLLRWPADAGIASQLAARRIVEHIRRAGWSVERRPPARAHSTPPVARAADPAATGGSPADAPSTDESDLTSQ